MFNFGFGGPPGPREPVDTEKFYTLLGVSKSATQNEIKKAYRRAAMKHHPDRGGDEEMFKEISKAYEVLGDPEKRELYNEYGEEGVRDGGGGGGMPADIFDLFGGGGRRRGPGAKRKGDDVVFPLNVGLPELYNGTTKKLRLTKNVICKTCKGKGGMGEIKKCVGCKGQGVKIIIRQIGPGMIQQMQSHCNDCDGEGTVMDEKDRCKKCGGNKTVEEKKTLEVFVAKGMRHNQRVTFKGEADESPGTIPGDVIVVIKMNAHPVFRREGAHLFVQKHIPLIQALTGFSFVLEHLGGQKLLIKSKPGHIYAHGETQAIREEGMPQHNNPFVRGNLYIEFLIDLPQPEDITPQVAAKLKALLPGASDMDVDAADGEVDEVELEQVDIEAEKRRFAQEMGGDNAYDEDDGRGHPHAAGCRAQ